MYIAIDFDGTCVTHDYPDVGKDIGAVPVLKALVNRGHKLILYTMRGTDTIKPALDWFSANGILLYGINYNPSQKRWTNSKKVYANLYIDDAGVGIPLLFDEELSDRPFVDWKALEIILKNQYKLL